MQNLGAWHNIIVVMGCITKYTIMNYGKVVYSLAGSVRYYFTKVLYNRLEKE